MTNAAVGVPLLDDRRGDVRADLLLGAAGLEELAHPGVHAVDRRAGGAQLGHLGCVLAHPQLAQDRPGEGLRGLGERVAQPEHVRGRHRVGDRDPGRAAGEVADQQVRVLAVGPGDDLDAQLVQPQAGQPGASSRGTTSAGGARWPAAGSSRQVSRSWLAPVAPSR